MPMNVTKYQNVYQVYPGDALYVFTQRGCTMDVLCHLFDFMLLSVIGCTPTWKGTTPDRQGRHVQRSRRYVYKSRGGYLSMLNIIQFFHKTS